MSSSTSLLASFVLGATLVFSAPASFAQNSGAYVEAFAGKIFYETDFDLDETTFGARGGYRFGERWGVEGTISRQDVDDFIDFEIYFIDVSLRRSLVQGERTELFFVGGPGLFRADFGSFPFNDTEDELALHAGLGLDIKLGERFYLRPDVRARWVDGDLFDEDIHTEATFGVGFRF